MPHKTDFERGDFDIGNATLEEVAAKHLLTRHSKEDVDKYLKNPEPFSRFNYLIGSGYDGLWSVRIERLAKDTYDFYKAFVKPKERLPLSTVLKSIKYIFKPRSRFTDMEKEGFKTSGVVTELVNSVVAQAVSHSLGYEHNIYNKHECRKFFLDFVELD